MLERDIQRKILNRLRDEPGCWAVKVIAANRNGTPDILACVRGRFLAIEVKGPKGQTSVLQDHHIKTISQCGGEAVVVRSVQEIESLLSAIPERL